MSISKLNGKSIESAVASNTFAEELILSVDNLGNSGIRAFGIDTETDLGLFYTSASATGSITRLKELKSIRAIAVMTTAGNYLDIVDVDTRTSKYTLPTFNSYVNDVIVIDNYLVVVGNFTNFLKVIDLDTMLEITGFPAMAGYLFAVDSTKDGRIAVFGDFTNHFRVFDIYSKAEITGYPTYSLTIGHNYSSFTLRCELNIYNSSEINILFQDKAASSNYRTIRIDINSKSQLSDSLSSIKSNSYQPFYWDGTRYRGGGDNSINEQEINVTSGGSISQVALAESFNAVWVVYNKARTHRYSKKDGNSNLYKYTYSGTSSISTLTVSGNNVTSNRCSAIVTDLLKGT